MHTTFNARFGAALLTLFLSAAPEIATAYNEVPVENLSPLYTSGGPYSTSNTTAPLDGNLNTFWYTVGQGQYIAYDLGGYHNLSSVDIAFYNNYAQDFYLYARTETSPGYVWLGAFQSAGGPTTMEHFEINQDIYADAILIQGWGGEFTAYSSQYDYIILNELVVNERVLNHDVDDFLSQHVPIRQALEFEVVVDTAALPSDELYARTVKGNNSMPCLVEGDKAGQLTPYDGWPAYLKNMLALAFDHYATHFEDNHEAPFDGLTDFYEVPARPANLLSPSFIPETLENETITVISQSETEKLYINQIAMQLALQHADLLQWGTLVENFHSLRSELLYSSSRMFMYFRYPRDYINFSSREDLACDFGDDPGEPGYVVLNHMRRPWEAVTPFSPAATIQQMMAYGLDFRDDASQLEFVTHFLEWTRNLEHCFGRPNNFDMEGRNGYWGGQAFENMFITPVADPLNTSDDTPYFVTNGCGSTLHFMYLLLKLVSIPLDIEMLLVAGSHRYGVFYLVDINSGGNLYFPEYVLSHGDTPYEKGYYAYNGDINYQNWLIHKSYFDPIKEAAELRYGPPDWSDSVELSSLSHFNLMHYERAKLINFNVANYCNSDDQQSFMDNFNYYIWTYSDITSIFSVDLYPITHTVSNGQILPETFPVYENTLTYDSIGQLVSQYGLDCADAEIENDTIHDDCLDAHEANGTLHLSGECPERWR